MATTTITTTAAAVKTNFTNMTSGDVLTSMMMKMMSSDDAATLGGYSSSPSVDSSTNQSFFSAAINYLRYSSIGYPFWQYWIDVQDPRTKDFFFVNHSPYPILTMMAFYVYFAKSLGPRLMRDRKPFDLKSVMIVYNFVMALSNLYFVSLVLLYCERGARFFDWKYPDRSISTPNTMWELNQGWWYWMTKFLDLLDTVFFVLRKKHETHISFLHLYHHTVVPIFGYLCMKHNAVMPATGLFCLINGSIHVIMYSYYGLSLLGPNVRKYLWWKKYITQLQIGQFIFGIIYGIIMIFKQEGYPQFWFWFGMTQPFFFAKLFYDFYKRSYKENAAAGDKDKVIAKKME